MRLSRASDQADPTGALLLPVAVASAEPAQTLTRDELRALALTVRMLPLPLWSGAAIDRGADGTARVDRTRFLLETTCGKQPRVQAGWPVVASVRRENVGASIDIVRVVEQRLREIEVQLASYDELVRERDRVRRALGELRGNPTVARPAGDGAAATGRRGGAGAARGGAPSADQTWPRSSTTWRLIRARRRPRLLRAPASTAVSSTARPHGLPAPAGCGGQRRGIARSATSRPPHSRPSRPTRPGPGDIDQSLDPRASLPWLLRLPIGDLWEGRVRRSGSCVAAPRVT